MSFVPLHGPATFVAADPPRAGEVEFTGGARSVRLAVPAAIPVLTRAMRDERAHPSVALLGAGTLLAMKMVAAGRLQHDAVADAWRAGPLQQADADGVRRLADARGVPADLAVEEAERIIRALLDAVADSMAPRTRSAPRALRPVGEGRSRRRIEAIEDAGLPHEIDLALRVEAPAEEVAGGLLHVVVQVHDREDLTHFCDAADLWEREDHGFARRTRLGVSTGLRRLSREVWEPLGELLAEEVPGRLTLSGPMIGDLLEAGVPALREAGVEVYWPKGLRAELTPRAVVSGGPREAQLQEGVLTEKAVFSFDWRLALGDSELSDDEMAELARATTPLIRLRDNWVVVDPATVRSARRRLGRSRELGGVEAIRAALTGRLEVDGRSVEVHPGASLLRVRDRITDAAHVAPLPQPTALQATMRDYQLRGLTWLAELTGTGLGACLADDMGLGKTITLIGLHLHRRERGLASAPTLVVCPASLLGNWEAEIRRFAPSTGVRRFHGPQRTLTGLVADEIVLTTYSTMRLAADELAATSWDLVVADEAQHVKNPRSSTAMRLRQIPSLARVALTGTPVENDLTELWAILDWATPGLLGSRNAFRKVWAAPIESGTEPEKARQFAQLVDPFLLRRRKSDPGIAPELPPKTETDQVVGLTQEQAVLYEALVRDSMERIERADEDTRRGLVLALLTGLKQICNHPAHYLRQAGGRLRHRSEKLALLDELMGTILAEDGAVLVFTQYVEMGRLLERHLTEAGIGSLFLHGGVPVRQREQMVARFQAGEVPVFLLSLKAGGTGLNLTRADHVVHYDRWWNPAVEDQATDRAYRIGQTRPVQVHRLVTEGTVEERVAELLTRKRSLADAVLGRGEAALTELDDDELRDLVALRRPHG